MYAPKVTRSRTKKPDATSYLAQRASKLVQADRDEARASQPRSALSGFGHDFSAIRPSAAREGNVETKTIPIRAVIPAFRPGSSGASKTVHDAPIRGASPQPKSAEPGPEAGGQAASPPVERGKTLYIAQMAGSPTPKDTSGIADSVNATFAYSGAPTRGGVVMGAGDFGLTSGSVKAFSNVVITPDVGKFTVTADLKQTVKWDTRATTGPDGQVNITSDTDAALTSANYAQVVTDLTPNAADLKGRPPRTGFWSKDITEKHEKFHADERVDLAKTGATDAKTWLATQNAATKEEVPALLDTAWNEKIFKFWDGRTDPPGVEERAYTDGSASYTARATAIKTKGDKGAAGGYPAPP